MIYIFIIVLSCGGPQLFVDFDIQNECTDVYIDHPVCTYT